MCVTCEVEIVIGGTCFLQVIKKAFEVLIKSVKLVKIP